jgi:hypothetical protein
MWSLPAGPWPESYATLHMWTQINQRRPADGGRFPMIARSVADFYRDFMRLLQSAGLDVRIWKTPVEVSC